MPYVSCPDCHARVYSAARHAGRDDCPLCGTSLAPPLRRAHDAPASSAAAQEALTFDQSRPLPPRARP